MMYFVKLLVLMLACFAQAVPPPLPSQICTDRIGELVQEFASQETIPDIESYVQTNSLTGEYHFNKSMVDDYCSLFRKVVPFYENNIAGLRILCNTHQLRHYLEIMSHIKNIAMSLCDDEKMKDLKALLTCVSNNHIAQHGFVGCLHGTVRGLSLSKPDSLICTEDDHQYQSWFTSVATSFKSCFCQFDSCAPESTKSITEMITSHQVDACEIVKFAVGGE
ncbi:uncharacterized protein LOC127731056 isoform X1 [Mytilus californianus]|uniref:uncharacterized protein LOC127731056 isoform X1 n=1 Tax=Mytilus californianus TaxID=6549 RepID=UPI0022460B09|nr:uncharacterized protein LOC127731056 isoform X1 [Mytilus californianus]